MLFPMGIRWGEERKKFAAQSESIGEVVASMPPRESNPADALARKLSQAGPAPYPGFSVDGDAHIYPRPGNDWTDRFSSIAATLPQLKARTVILDGEMIVPNQGGGDFNAMQNSVGPKSRKAPALHQFQCFDLLYIDGLDLRQGRLIDRKAVLKQLLDDDARGYLRLVERI
jgi:hypothetical protein